MNFYKQIIFFTKIILFFLSSIINAKPANVWDVLAAQFTLNHETTRPEVQSQIRWLIAHPSYLQKIARQSEPYIYHIVNEIKKRKLPGEIALIPIIESAFDPFAYSGAGAAGLWQLMPGTGTDLGLKQDWWYDGRRSIGPSTNAALNYLTYLHRFFHGDWLLAFAAYDSGEGTIAKTIKNSAANYENKIFNFFRTQNQQKNKVSFWSLKVPQETRAYIPRLLALSEVIQNPKRYKLNLPSIPHQPYFEEVNIGSQIDLNHAAKLAGISYKDLIRLNPGYNRWATAPYRPYKLLIPANKVESFNRNLANVPIESRVSWTRHKISAGDNLTVIAQKYHTTVNLIRELNQLKTNSIKNGQYVLIPANKKPAKILKNTKVAINPKKSILPLNKKMKVIHIVQKDESITSIMKKYKVSARQIQVWNNLNKGLQLQKNQQLIIWKEIPSSQFYVVKKGDSVNLISKKLNISPSILAYLNPSLQKKSLHIGQKIRLG